VGEQADNDTAVQGIGVPRAVCDRCGHEGIVVAIMREEGLVFCHGARPWRILLCLSSSALCAIAHWIGRSSTPRHGGLSERGATLRGHHHPSRRPPTSPPARQTSPAPSTATAPP